MNSFFFFFLRNGKLMIFEVNFYDEIEAFHRMLLVNE